MGADRFGTLTRLLPGVRSRRGALTALLGEPLAPLGLSDIDARKNKGKGKK